MASAQAAFDTRPEAEDYAKALMNILEDTADERRLLRDSHAAVVNILEDFNEERRQLELMQRAVMNILEDAGLEKMQLEDTQRAAVNILADFSAEKDHLQNVEKAIFNIFDDLHEEKRRLEVTQAELLSSGQEVAASLREKEVLLQEVHHRVKNNLQVISSLVNMQLRKLRDPASRSALEECRNRVHAIALIHQTLYQARDYARVPFSAYAKNLADNILNAGASPGNVKFEMESESIALVVNKAIPCGLILNELISNALKHAFPNERHGTIRLHLLKADGHLEIEVADDGIGMNTNYDPITSSSLGLQLVWTLVEQLHGKVEIIREPGTTFRIRFPAEVFE
jgi:two-component sensor histidine kinase